MAQVSLLNGFCYGHYFFGPHAACFHPLFLVLDRSRLPLRPLFLRAAHLVTASAISSISWQFLTAACWASIPSARGTLFWMSLTTLVFLWTFWISVCYMCGCSLAWASVSRPFGASPVYTFSPASCPFCMVGLPGWRVDAPFWTSRLPHHDSRTPVLLPKRGLHMVRPLASLSAYSGFPVVYFLRILP